MSTDSANSFSDWATTCLHAIDNPPKNLCWHLVVDPCANETLPNMLNAFAQKLKVWPLFLNTYDETVIPLGSQFIRCAPQSRFIKWCIGHMQENPIGILVLTEEAKSDELYEHLQNFFECVLPSRRKVLFRYYDPRLLYGFTTYSDKRPSQLLLGPSTQIKAWEPGRAVAVELAQQEDNGWRCSEELGLSDEFMDHLWAQTKIHTVIGAITKEMGSPTGEKLKRQPLPESYNFVEKVQTRLKKYALDNYNLMVATILTMKNDFSFWDIESIKNKLDQGQNNDTAMRVTLRLLLQA